MLKNILEKNLSILGPKFINGFKWNLLGQIIVRLITLVSGIILARMLLADDFGKYSFFCGFLVFISGLLSLSIRETNSRNISYYIQDKKKVDDIIIINICLSFLLGLFGSISLYIICLKFDFIPSELYNNYIILLGSLCVLSEILIVNSYGTLEGFKLFKAVNKLSIIIIILKITSAITLAYFFGYNGGLLGWFLSSWIGALISNFTLFKIIKKRKIKITLEQFKRSKSTIIELINFSIPASLIALSSLLLFWISQTIILKFEKGPSEIGLFNIAFQWKNIALYLPVIITNMSQPFFSEYQGRKDAGKSMVLSSLLGKIVFISSVLIALTVFCLSFFIENIYGFEYEKASVLLQIMLIGVVFSNLSELKKNILFSKGLVWVAAKVNLCTAVISFLLFLFLKNFLPLSEVFVFSLLINEILIYISFNIYFRLNENR